MDGYHTNLVNIVIDEAWNMLELKKKKKTDYMDLQSGAQKSQGWLAVSHLLDWMLRIPKSPKLIQFLENTLNYWITTYKKDIASISV